MRATGISVLGIEEIRIRLVCAVEFRNLTIRAVELIIREAVPPMIKRGDTCGAAAALDLAGQLLDTVATKGEVR